MHGSTKSLFFLGLWTVTVQAALTCPPQVAAGGVALGQTSLAADESILTCVYPEAGECSYFTSNGTLSFATTQCPVKLTGSAQTIQTRQSTENTQANTLVAPPPGQNRITPTMLAGICIVVIIAISCLVYLGTTLFWRSRRRRVQPHKKLIDLEMSSKASATFTLPKEITRPPAAVEKQAARRSIGYYSSTP
ncbi:hypothetical protein C8R45DRAFT_985548 [Mycena sanguinolenta]|nr:hypothetical protein C8R45DRAFT_985548 [Mycena sanguinolenta]